MSFLNVYTLWLLWLLVWSLGGVKVDLQFLINICALFGLKLNNCLIWV